MGNPSRPDLHPKVAAWGKSYIGRKDIKVSTATSSALYGVFQDDLKDYFRLCALSRSKSASTSYISSALQDVFGVRSLLEKSIIKAIDLSLCSLKEQAAGVFRSGTG